MSDSPLFPNFNKLIREQQAALRQWAKAQKAQAPRSGQPTRYSSRRSSTGRTGSNWLWNAVLSKFGDLGSIIDSMLRPNGQQLAPDVGKEIEAAQNLLQAFGVDTGSDQSAVDPIQVVRELVQEGQPPKPPSDADRRRQELERGLRRRTTPPEPPAEEPPNPPPNLVEGMIPVTSSNVHSIGWEWEQEGRTGNLLVRFLGGDSKHRHGPGPLYRYFGVDRSVFLAFQRAASKGSFVWSELRIRGTISGHQYPYELAGLEPGERVPRQAGLKRGQSGEFYLPRTFQGRRSSLPEQQVRGSRTNLVDNFRGRASQMNLRPNGR